MDRIVILGLKCDRITDATRRAEAQALREVLLRCWQEAGLPAIETLSQHEALRAVNTELWDIEDALREKERIARFDEGFIALARGVYLANTRRAALKTEIDSALGSPYTEPKWHPMTERDV